MLNSYSRLLWPLCSEITEAWLEQLTKSVLGLASTRRSPNLAKLGRIRADDGQIRQKCYHVGLMLPVLSQIGPHVAKTNVKVGQVARQITVRCAGLLTDTVIDN